MTGTSGEHARAHGSARWECHFANERRGDTLSEIAARYDVTVAELKRWNNRRSNNLRVGERLTIHQ